MSTIIYNIEDIGDAYAPSINAAFAELYAASGIKPRVLSPYGGRSTLAETLAIGRAGKSSDHYKGRAVDIDNWRAIQARIGASRFKAILAAHGWHNVQINGAPFPTEPWHYANHAAIPQGSSAGTPIPSSSPIPKGTNMTTLFHKISTANGKGPILYALAGDSPGTDANWIETTAQEFANQLSGQIGGPSAAVNDDTWEELKRRYLAPLRSGLSVGDHLTVAPDPAVAGLLTDIRDAVLSLNPADR